MDCQRAPRFLEELKEPVYVMPQFWSEVWLVLETNPQSRLGRALGLGRQGGGTVLPSSGGCVLGRGG